MTRRSAAATAAALTTALLAPPALPADRPAGRRAQPPAAAPVEIASPPLVAEHRYRIGGRVRILFFWTGSHEAGSARISWRRSGAATVIALLAGSEPPIAPRGINDWGYIREQVADGDAQVFGIRTLTDPGSLDEADAATARGQGPLLFGILCSTVTAGIGRAWTTTVRGGADVSYHHLPRVLDVAETAHWNAHAVARPSGSAPGFLSAIERLIQRTLGQPDAAGAHGPVTYVYKGSVYELDLRRRERRASEQIGSRVYPDVIRGEFRLRGRSSDFTADFKVTYGASGPLAGVPLKMSYDPHWWLRIEMALDDSASVPPDPDANPAELARMRDVCERASASGSPAS